MVTVEQRAASPQEVAVIDVLRRQADVRGVDVDGNKLEGWLSGDLVLAYVRGTCPKSRARTVRRILGRLIDDELVEAAMIRDRMAYRWSPRRPL